MDEQRIFDLKNLCVRKWRVENPEGYFGQMQHTSKRAASEWICKLAGFGTLEEADAYFKHQNVQEQKDMIEEANVIQRGQPAWTPEQQSYIRSQVQSGLEGTEVKRDFPKSVMALPILVLGMIAAVWLLLMGKIRKG